VPAHDEQGVRNGHNNRITCIQARCPGSVRHVDGMSSVKGHVTPNMSGRGGIPGVIRQSISAYYGRFYYPCRIQLSTGSVADSAGGMCWQSHQLPPGQSA
jgi:hypothetical protein